MQYAADNLDMLNANKFIESISMRIINRIIRRIKEVIITMLWIFVKIKLISLLKTLTFKKRMTSSDRRSHWGLMALFLIYGKVSFEIFN